MEVSGHLHGLTTLPEGVSGTHRLGRWVGLYQESCQGPFTPAHNRNIEATVRIKKLMNDSLCRSFWGLSGKLLT
jgi:hypothetical protein